MQLYGFSYLLQSFSHLQPPKPFPFLSDSRREVETDPDSGFETSDCSQSQLNEYNSTTQCGALSDPDGPFAACHATLSPESYQG